MSLYDVLTVERIGKKSFQLLHHSIHKLEQFNGCILADSVGLGKTFTALAVIKYYENRNKNVLVLCPKKLSDNWNTYKGNKKALIFTAFSDTAEYLYAHLSAYLKKRFRLECALVTGSVNGRSTLGDKGGAGALNRTLTLFSPLSKGRDALYPGWPPVRRLMI